ncbi:hypothetical protein FDECE_15912 [Fusarium decemcellulare]|nr:hypothetical protein FDECE_15912 [Fusarium decemcellulare]
MSTAQAGDGTYSGPTYSSESVMVIACSALALYNGLELLALIFTTFKYYRGLYFWSILLAAFGVVPYTVGWFIDYFDVATSYVGMAICSVGWVLLITGQSVVLYSRLHLVLNSVNIQRAVFWMIVGNGVVWHTTMTILLFTTGSDSSKDGSHSTPLYKTMEKIQMTFFCAQEFIISGLYIWRTVDILQTSFGSKRKFMYHLFIVNVFIVAMDIALLVIMYKNHFTLEQGVKVVVYSIKLKLEFAVLGKLVEFVQNRGGSNPSGPSQTAGGGFVELSGSRGKKVRSGSGPETVYLEDMGRRRGAEQITVTTKIEVERGGGEMRDDESTDQLYDAAIKQISRGQA